MAEEKEKKLSIPKSFYPFFWDVDVKKIDPSKKAHFVVQRLLDKGDDNCIRWVRKNFSKRTIRETLTQMRDFSPWVGNFWRLFLKIPQEEVLCLQKPYLLMRRTHWPF